MKSKSLQNLDKAEKLVSDDASRRLKYQDDVKLLSRIPDGVLNYLYNNKVYYFNLSQISKKYAKNPSKYKSLKYIYDKKGMNLKRIESLVANNFATVPSDYLKKYKSTDTKFLKITTTNLFKDIMKSILKTKQRQNKNKGSLEISSNRANKQSIHNLHKAYDLAFKIWSKSIHIRKPKYATTTPIGNRASYKVMKILRNLICVNYEIVNLSDSQWCMFKRHLFFGKIWKGSLTTASYKFLTFNWLFRLTFCNLISVSKPYKTKALTSDPNTVIKIKITPFGRYLFKKLINKKINKDNIKNKLSNMRYGKMLKKYIFYYYFK